MVYNTMHLWTVFFLLLLTIGIMAGGVYGLVILFKKPPASHHQQYVSPAQERMDSTPSPSSVAMA
jgi:hypothetical protein